jgi:monofunctional biosynthetic peptidoglycan transglycosylase
MSRAKKGGRRWVKWLFLGPLLLVLLLQLYFFLMVWCYARVNPGTTSFQRQQLAELRAVNPKAVLVQQWVPYASISDNLKRAVVAYTRNNTKHKVVGGGSTITQQLAKNLFLSGSRNYLRKGQEMIIAFMLETVMSKERILELYLNVVEMGRGVFGAEAAARHYFNTTAARLNPAQAARLAVMLPNPRFYDKHQTGYLARRTSLIQRRMSSAELP